MRKTYEVIVRGGLVADGSGGEPYEADVAVRDGRIAAVGRVTDSAELEIDAKGKLVMPGLRRHPHALRWAGHLG